jgi:hypothetical protein
MAKEHDVAVGSPSGACANCEAVLAGPYCHVCGQSADRHHRSLPHLAWEAVESLFHLDGRLLRTVPDLFLRPGRLARDYMEHRIARHVPPFRTFLVALLVFIFAAEYGANQVSKENARQQRREAAAAAKMRLEAAKDRVGDLKEAADDRASDLKDPDEKPAKVEARYKAETAKIEARYARDMDEASRVAAGLPPRAPSPTATTTKKSSWFNIAIRKATADPEYYLTVLFTWAHRAAILLLPIVALSLALVYRDKRQYFIYDHLLVAMNLLSFGFLANAVAFVLPLQLTMWWVGLVAIWTPVNLFQTLRGGYGSTVLGAVLKTLVVWITTVTAFSVLVMSLLVFSLTQL